MHFLILCKSIFLNTYQALGIKIEKSPHARGIYIVVKCNFHNIASSLEPHKIGMAILSTLQIETLKQTED